MLCIQYSYAATTQIATQITRIWESPIIAHANWSQDSYEFSTTQP